MDPRPDPCVERVLQALVDYDAGSDKAPDEEMRACYTLVDKIVSCGLCSEALLLEKLDPTEKALVATCLELYLCSTDVTTDEETEIRALKHKFCAARAAQSETSEQLLNRSDAVSSSDDSVLTH